MPKRVSAVVISVSGLIWTLTTATSSLMACVLCANQGDPLSVEIERARLVVFGAVTSSRLKPNAVEGVSEFAIEAVLKDDGSLKDRKSIPISRYVPANPSIKFLVFIDVVDGTFDAYRSLVFRSNRVVDYLRRMPARAQSGSSDQNVARLKYLFDYLNDTEPEIAADAFKEFAVTSDRDVALAAPHFSAEKLRQWLIDPKTDPSRLSLYGYLLGACGSRAADAALLKNSILRPDERLANAVDGLLAGLIQLDPEEGWRLAKELLQRGDLSFVRKRGILTTLAFLYSAHREAVQEQVAAITGLMLLQPDIMDLAIEHLRRWQLWTHTEQILSQYGKPAASAPMTQRSIIRYALSCAAVEGHPKAKPFLEDLRRSSPDLVKEVEEGLRNDALPR